MTCSFTRTIAVVFGVCIAELAISVGGEFAGIMDVASVEREVGMQRTFPNASKPLICHCTQASGPGCSSDGFKRCKTNDDLCMVIKLGGKIRVAGCTKPASCQQTGGYICCNADKCNTAANGETKAGGGKSTPSKDGTVTDGPTIRLPKPVTEEQRHDTTSKGISQLNSGFKTLLLLITLSVTVRTL